MITTSAVIKNLLNITDTSYDSRITALLPMVESDLINYCNNQFLSSVNFAGDITIKGTLGVYTLECSGGISASGLADDDVIYLSGSVRNDGYFTITNLTDTVITVAEKVYAEAEQGLKLSLAVFPVELPMYISQMIWHKMDKIKDSGIQGETIKSYSYTRSDSTGDAGYPMDILHGLDRFRFIKTGRGRRREQFIDRRGNFVGDIITDNVRGGIV